MWIEYDQIDFVKWTKKRVRRWIDLDEVLKNNAFMRAMVKSKTKRKKIRKVLKTA